MGIFVLQKFVSTRVDMYIKLLKVLGKMLSVSQERTLNKAYISVCFDSIKIFDLMKQ